MSKTPKGKQSNTLFSYFKKTPKKDESNDGKDVLSPRRSPNSDKKSKNVENNISSEKESNEKTQAKNSGGKEPSSSAVQLGDVVWAKLEGFPWWPSLVCNHPSQNTHLKGSKNLQVHVQFFDEPPSRAWIKEKNIKPFLGSRDASFQKGGQFYSLNNKIQRGAKEADKALTMGTKERMKLVVELQPSSEEENEGQEDDEKMDFDPDIFDDEMSDCEVAKENSIENKEKENTVACESPDKEAIKTDRIVTKSKRKAAKEAVIKNKRRRIIASSSGGEDSEDDFKPASSSSDGDSEDLSSGAEEAEESAVEEESGSETPIKESRKRKNNAKSTTKSKARKVLDLSSAADKKTSPTLSENTKSKLSMFSSSEQANGGDDSSQRDASSFSHLHLDFLQPDKIKDAEKKLKSDPDYNPKTLYVPESFLSKQTPAMRQWWELKIHHFDTVLFFKVGKFYELYHMDAVTGVNELGLIYMKGDWAHSGFPEIAYNRYADALIQKGYKVARVEQTETPDMMSERCKNMGRSASKFDKVVRREICQVSTKGTKTYNYLDGDTGDTSSKYILAVCEKADSKEGTSTYGVCFVDTFIGTFHLGQFTDDRYLSRMRTLLAHYTPVQVLYERGRLSAQTLQLFNANLTNALKEALSPGTEFWESGKTLKTLAEEDYFKVDRDVQMPEVIKSMVSETDALGLTAAESSDLAIRALGAIIWYLQYCLLDQELLSMRKFEEYIPKDTTSAITKKQSTFDQNLRHMVLDGVTMANLDVVWNPNTMSLEGTLLEKLNTCSTAFGKRLFHQWLCAPLCQPSAINDRLDAVDDLIQLPGVIEECVTLMKKLPDLERLLSRIHSLGSAGKSKNHPDSRAILYEEVTYSKRKIEDFLTTIEGFKLGTKIVGQFSHSIDSIKSKLLKRTVMVSRTDSQTDAHFPDITDDLNFFDTAFDHKKARKDGVIVPSKGVDADYDQALEEIECVQKQLDDYLETQKKVLNCRSLVYWGTAKNRYQIEVQETSWKNIPDLYILMSSKKGAKRFRTPHINDLLRQLTEAEEKKDVCLKDIMRRIFHSFDERHKKWLAVIECLSVLDVLIALSVYSRGGDNNLCRPEFILPDHDLQPMLEIRDGRHPCVSRTYEGGDFIPNDTVIGVPDDTDVDSGYSQSPIVLVTGPNMGGKSTLMRQVGLITIMAQMGCYVPAAKCRLTPIDRIFTRLGASDRIMSGESTFFVELSETSAILKHATRHSLVLMDELGRGTATYDGMAIASAVVKELSNSVCCRSLFSTHYHTLVEHFKHDANVRLGHMACMVENENNEDPSQETITFLYKFVKGVCPKSYGFNAARLASIPEEIISCAVQKSKDFELTIEGHKLFRSIWSTTSTMEMKTLLEQMLIF